MNKSSKPKKSKVRKGLPRPIYYLILLVILYLPTLSIRKFTDTDLQKEQEIGINFISLEQQRVVKLRIKWSKKSNFQLC